MATFILKGIDMCAFVRSVLRWMGLLYVPEMAITRRQLKRLGLNLTPEGFRKFGQAGAAKGPLTWGAMAAITGSPDRAYGAWMCSMHPVARVFYRAVIVRPFVFRAIYRDVIRAAEKAERERPDACDRTGWRKLDMGGPKQ